MFYYDFIDTYLLPIKQSAFPSTEGTTYVLCL